MVLRVQYVYAQERCVNENSNSFSFGKLSGCSTRQTLYRNINIRIAIYVEISFRRLGNCLSLYRFCFPLLYIY